MYFWILGSGSKGNSCVIRTDQALFLIDNGFSGKELLRRLANVEILPQDIDGIIVSHEHTDHVKGVGVFARKFKTPIYINKSTYFRTRKLLNNTEIRFFESGGSIEYADLTVGTFSLSHDAGDPVGFVLGQKSQKNGE
ncbi:MAG: MBL fold metallo-hydrolase, partial [Calditrichota bacterium]